jgi:hypothetical protein
MGTRIHTSRENERTRERENERTRERENERTRERDPMSQYSSTLSFLSACMLPQNPFLVFPFFLSSYCDVTILLSIQMYRQVSTVGDIFLSCLYLTLSCLFSSFYSFFFHLFFLTVMLRYDIISINVPASFDCWDILSLLPLPHSFFPMSLCACCLCRFSHARFPRE